MGISAPISAAKGIFTLISGEKGPKSPLISGGKARFLTLISEDFLAFALREVPKLSEEKKSPLID